MGLGEEAERRQGRLRRHPNKPSCLRAAALVPGRRLQIKKWCPAFKLLTYYGSAKQRKDKRQGWSKPNAFHICITSYTLVLSVRTRRTPSATQSEPSCQEPWPVCMLCVFR